MPTVETPIAISAFPTQTDGVWTLPWALVFDRAIMDPETLVYEMMIDTSPTFGSPNLVHVTNTSKGIVAFQNGPLGKAIDVSLPKGSLDGDVTWYWKLRINGGGYGGSYVSSWTPTNTFVVPKDQTRDVATSLWNDVADASAYSKDANSSNMFKVLQMVARELNSALLEKTYTQSDLSLEQSRDMALKDNFGLLVGISAVASEPAVSFRWKVRELFKSFLNSPGVITGIRRVVRTFVGEDPTILDATNIQGWILPFNYIKDPAHPEVQPIIVLYDAIDKGFHWKVRVWNSWNLTYDQAVLEEYVNLIKPAHTKTTFIYPTQRHAQVRFNSSADWNSCVLTNLEVNGAGGLTLTAGQSSGTAVSGVITVDGIDSWDTFDTLWDPVGQTISVQLRSSPSGDVGTFSSWETLVKGQSPSTTPLQDHLQFQVSISTSDVNNRPVLNALYLNVLHV